MNCVCTANGNTIFNNEDVINIHFETVTFQNTNKVDFIPSSLKVPLHLLFAW